MSPPLAMIDLPAVRTKSDLQGFKNRLGCLDSNFRADATREEEELTKYVGPVHFPSALPLCT